MLAPMDPAAAVFEPTGDLYKDYCAYCETADVDERDDVLDGITLVDEKGSPRNLSTPHNVHTKLFVRGLESPLYRADISPLTNAIPHCANLYAARFYSCSLTLDSYKLLTEAVYKAPNLISLAVDFNQTPLVAKDPTSSKREKAMEHYLWPQQARGGGAYDMAKQAGGGGGGGGGGDAKKPGGKDGGKGQKAAEEAAAAAAAAAEQGPLRIPDGWQSLLLTAVQELSLRGNGLGDAQAGLLAGSLEKAGSLLSLNLWGNQIGDEGARAFAQALAVNSRLTALNLGDNLVGDGGLEALVASLRQRDVGGAAFAALRAQVRDFQELVAPGTMPADPPAYPTHADLQAARAGDGADAAASAKKPPPKGKASAKDGAGGAAGGGTLPAACAWDRACVRIPWSGAGAGGGDDLVRVPGNRALWCLNVCNNRGITTEGLRCALRLLEEVGVPAEAAAAAGGAGEEPAAGSDEDRKASAAAAVAAAKRKSLSGGDEAGGASAAGAQAQASPPPSPAVINSSLARLTVAHPGLPAELLAQAEAAVKAIVAEALTHQAGTDGESG